MVAAARGLSLALAAVDSLAVILRALLESMVAAALGLSLAFVVVLLLVVVSLFAPQMAVSLAFLHHLRRLACRLFLLNKRVILVMVS